MIDWDESHVDVPDLDLALPHNAAGLDDDAYDIAAQASAAWAAAVCWDPSGTDQFAVKRLAEVRAGLSGANRQSAPNAVRCPGPRRSPPGHVLTDQNSQPSAR
jgi:hypothetical protein